MVTALYVILSVVATWPVALRFASHLPHDPGDPVLSLTLLQWHASTRLFTPEWWDGVGFYPLADTLTLTDPRLGPAIISTPVIRLTGSALAGYNTAFVLSFVFSALAAHALAFALTRSHVAGLVAGCAFAFAPYRASRLAQLELLGAYWMPIGLLALHRLYDTRRWPWLVVFAAALTAQGLFCAYYLPMFAVLAGLWLLWFTRRRELRLAGWTGLAALAGVAPLVPLFRHYASAHERLGLFRGIDEIQRYSADVSNVWSRAPELTFWPSALADTERYLFPGLTVLALATLHAVHGRVAVSDTPVLRTARRALGAVGAAALAAASVPILIGPVDLDAGPLHLSLSSYLKPLSIGIGAFALLAALHPRAVAAIRARGIFGFYAAAAFAMFVLALGPDPTLFGVPILYKAPYSWLMAAPPFDASLRAPSRFGMLMALALAVAAALAFDAMVTRCERDRPADGRHPRAANPDARGALVLPSRAVRDGIAPALVILLILIEGWIAPIATVEPPRPFAWPSRCAALPRLELPIGAFALDAAAEHRALLDGVRSVNGLSGFVPPHVLEFTVAARARDDGALNALAEVGPLCIAVHRGTPGGEEMFRWVRAHPYTRPLGAGDGRDFLMLRKVRPRVSRIAGDLLPIAAAHSNEGPLDTGELLDRNRSTGWETFGDGSAPPFLTLALGCRADVETVGVAHGGGRFALSMSVDVSPDGADWTTAWRDRLGGPVVRAALREPRLGQIDVPIEGAGAVRYVRLRALALDRDAGWRVADLQVRGRCVE